MAAELHYIYLIILYLLHLMIQLLPKQRNTLTMIILQGY